MAALAHKIQRWLHYRVILIDAVYFLRPGLFFGGDVPAEAAGPAKALPFDQIGLAAAPRIFRPLSAQGENRCDADGGEAHKASANRVAFALIAVLERET